MESFMETSFEKKFIRNQKNIFRLLQSAQKNISYEVKISRLLYIYTFFSLQFFLHNY